MNENKVVTKKETINEFKGMTIDEIYHEISERIERSKSL